MFFAKSNSLGKSSLFCLLILGTQFKVPVFTLAYSPALSTGEIEKPPRFRAEVNQVVLYATVYDKAGELISDLKQADFTILEDGSPVTITYFSQDDVPSTSGIVIDKSGSMRSKQNMVHQAIKLFLSLSHSQNEHYLVMFDREIHLEEDFTRDADDIREMLDNTVVGGGTAMYDAIWLALDKADSGSEAKKVVTVFTDGEDRNSYYQHEELLDKLLTTNVQLYVVAFLDRTLNQNRGFFGVFKSPYEKIRAKVNSIADVSGAKVYFPEKIQELNTVFMKIASELRNQYRIAYITHNPLKNGGWRTIDVHLKDQEIRKLTVETKKGYFAGPKNIK